MVMLTNQADTLSDGSGNWDYHDNTACLWRVMPEGASSVTLYFTEFETEEGFDFLKIYDLQTQQLIAEYSGSYSPGVPDPVTSPSGKMFLTFNSGTSGTAPGWEAYYESDLVKVPELEIISNMLIFPNPGDGLINIRLKNHDGQNIKLAISDPAGRIVFGAEKPSPGGDQISLDLRKLSPGIYFLRAESTPGRIEYHKIIIR
jgi:hypothetical protein